MEKIIPFSNATEASRWEFKNCDDCSTKSGCRARYNIQRGYVVGYISKKTAEFIGYSNGELTDCKNKNTRVIKKLNKVDTLQPKLFNN